MWVPMLEQYAHGKLVWINLKNPTTDEVHKVMSDHDIAPILVGDLRSRTPRETVTMRDHAVKFSLSLPIVKRTDITHPHQIKFILTKGVLITTQYEDIEAVERFKKQFEVIATLDKLSKKLTAADLCFSLIEELYNSADSKLDYLATRLTDIEADVFDGKEKEMVFEISQVSKKLISFRQAFKAQNDVFTMLSNPFESIFGKASLDHLEEKHTRYMNIMSRINALFEALRELRSTNNAMLTTKQNETIKILTIMAFITFPLTLMSSLFGMNTENTPIVGSASDFWIVIAMMVFAAACFFIYFKYMKWL